MSRFNEHKLECTLSDDDVMTLRELHLAHIGQIGTGDVKGAGTGHFEPMVAINNSPDVARRRALFEKLVAATVEFK